MTDKMAKMVYAIATNPMYNNFAKESIRKFAENKLKLHHIARKDNITGAQLHRIFSEHTNNHWKGHLDAILKHHRYHYANDYLPAVLPSGSRIAAADLIGKKYNREVEALLERLKKCENKLCSKVKASVKKK